MLLTTSDDASSHLDSDKFPIDLTVLMGWVVADWHAPT